MNEPLNEDIQLKGDSFGQFDMMFKYGDIVNLKGNDSLRNACIITIMTRFNELKHNPLYEDFGCRVHELIKTNMSNMTRYKLELYIADALENMRRVKNVNEILIEVNNNRSGYTVMFNITSINDEYVRGVVDL